MQMRRFVAPNIRLAMKLIKKEQGDSAVILSQRKVAEGVEVVSAVDHEIESVVSEAYGEPVENNPGGNIAAQVAEQMVNFQRPVSRPTEMPLSSLSSQPAMTQAYQTPSPQPLPATHASQSSQFSGSSMAFQQASAAAPSVGMSHLQEEMRQMKGMLENQLAGLAWGDYCREQPARVELLKKLRAIGLGYGLCHELVNETADAPTEDEAWARMQQRLTEKLHCMEDEILTQGGVVALVGTTGVGKTTTIAKLAARFAMRFGASQVAMISTDCYRVGAAEQLRMFGELIGVPVFQAENGAVLQAQLDELKNRKLVLVDTAGLSQRDLRLSELFATLQCAGQDIKTYVVLSAAAQMASLNEVVKAFSKVPLSGAVLTKLDEASNLGGSLSVVIEHELPVVCLGDGQRVPEDLHVARSRELIDRALSQMCYEEVGGEASMALQFGKVLSHA
jgi:flagellar biosynthesis protein FlhF